MTTPSTPPAANPPKAGWFEDPQDPQQLRYFDGIVWTQHTTPLVSPSAQQSSIGRPPSLESLTRTDPSQGAPGTPGQAGPEQPGGQPGAQPPAAPNWSAPPSPYRHPSQTGVQRQGIGGELTLPDGARLAAWWQRLLGRLIDSILVSLLGALVAFPWTTQVIASMNDFFAQTMEAATSGGTPPTAEAMMTAMMPALLPISLITTAVSVIWEVAFLSWRGATPGKMVLGTAVRSVDRPGRISPLDAFKRQVINIVSTGFSVVPVLSAVGSLLSIMDPVWLLLDAKRQRLSDKVAGTVVVKTR